MTGSDSGLGPAEGKPLSESTVAKITEAYGTRSERVMQHMCRTAANKHYSEVKMSAPASHITGVPLLSQALAQQVQITENIKAPRHWSLWGEFPAQRANNAGNVSIRWRRHEVWQKIMYRQTTLVLNTFEIPFSLLSTYFDVWSR